ncbi:MAG TPA: hypothetical protein VMZ52_10825 [Bryobacteraceae bacterium]|nr:hypothetical protein [Bryobacteraceae bacterium]
MDAGGLGWGRRALLNAIAGMHIGVIGGLIMLAWFALSAPLIGQPWWTTINLLASHYYTARTIRLGPGMATATGAALQIIACGAVGAITGLLTPGGRLFGVLVAAAWYLLGYFLMWKRQTPLLAVYGSQPLLIIGYFLYGSALGWHPRIAAKLRD